MKRLMALFLFASVAFSQSSHHVTTTGTAGGAGTLVDPWSMAAAVSKTTIAGGDTVYVHGGSYTGQFVITVDSLIWKAYQSERPILIDAGGATPLTINGANTTIWGLEFRCTNLDTNNQQQYGINPNAANIRVINCVMTDALTCGLYHNENATNVLVYGNIFLWNGRKTNNVKNGYNVYAQGKQTVKNYRDNWFLGALGLYDVHFYGSASGADSFHVARNIFASGTTRDPTLEIGTEDSISTGNVIDTNFIFGVGKLGKIWEEYGNKGLRDYIVRGNYWLNGHLYFNDSSAGMTFTGNTVWGWTPYIIHWSGGSSYIDTSAYEDNTWAVQRDNVGVDAAKPFGVVSKIYPNACDPTRANLVVMNLDSSESVDVDLSPFLAVGQSYTIKDVQAYYSQGDTTWPEFSSGIYSGGNVSFDMTSTTIRQPVSYPSANGAPVHTDRRWGTFIIFSGDTGGAVAPTITDPANASTRKGYTATFSVSATGNPAPTYQWQKGGSNIGGATSATYTTPAAALDDDGSLFRCIATNASGSDTSAAAVMSVYTGGFGRRVISR